MSGIWRGRNINRHEGSNRRDRGRGNIGRGSHHHRISALQHSQCLRDNSYFVRYWRSLRGRGGNNTRLKRWVDNSYTNCMIDGC